MSGAVPQEIEVTSEMIEAGVAEFEKYDRDYDTESAAVRRIFVAMWKAKNRTES